jgi:hypothetical protein
MGFRNKHRRGRGGGQHHHHHAHHGFGTGEANGLQPGDDVGNRKSFKIMQQPPDDLGNRKDPEEAVWVPVDDVGNRIDAAPTHEVSGVLLDMGGKFRRGRRSKGVSAPERVGRYVVGGVNPLIATTTPRPFPGKTLDESYGGGPPAPFTLVATPTLSSAADGARADAVLRGFDPDGASPAPFPDSDFESDGQGGRRRRRRGRGRDQVDGLQAQEISDRRAQRFFDFEEDDRFDYTLKTSAEQKRNDAQDAVRSIVDESGRDATVLARLIEDGTRPKILVTIDERGPAASLPPERRAPNSNQALFVMGNAALMSLNYLVNKIVNRYPDDRIRLAILPAADERLYLDALAEHQKLRRAPPPPRPVSVLPAASASAFDVVTPPPAPPSLSLLATPAPVMLPEAFEVPVEPAKPTPLKAADARTAKKVKRLAKDAPLEGATDGAGGAADEALTAPGAKKKKAAPKKKAKAAAVKKPRAKKAKKAAAPAAARDKSPSSTD